MTSLHRAPWIPGVALAALGILCSGGDAQAQGRRGQQGPPVRVVPVRALEFGDVIPGLEATVSHGDPTSGLWEIRAENDSVVRIDFTNLPDAMNGNGDSMPLRFEASSAYVVLPRASIPALVFDPAVGVTVELGRPGRAWIYLGGVASPRSDQSPGTYASPVTVTADYVATAATS